ncbi:LemA family protein [Porphyrobacter sp. HT-58-2]|uniref:LemA family protein n=1 Tax=Porphyrobacter sp. HT-58-2 TaxID=2023229 RepID=UPI0015598C5F|nr:LemA family protein [Porphyrobacter sp. HT-58-2]
MQEPISSTTNSFSEDTRLYDRSVESTNFLLDFWWLWLIAVVAAVAVASLLRIRRNLVALEARCASAFGDVDALLAERHALIPNLVAVTKEHIGHEIKVLDRLLEAQQNALETFGRNRMNAETEVGNAINQLINVAGSMPQLASSNQFPELRIELTRIEERVTASRRYYNSTVAEYDAARGGFVSSRLAALSGMPQHARFDLGEQRAEIAAPQRVAFG